MMISSHQELMALLACHCKASSTIIKALCVKKRWPQSNTRVSMVSRL